MQIIFDVLIILISLLFLGIVGMVAGVAIPGMFLSSLYPLLDWILPIKKKS